MNASPADQDTASRFRRLLPIAVLTLLLAAGIPWPGPGPARAQGEISLLYIDMDVTGNSIDAPIDSDFDTIPDTEVTSLGPVDECVSIPVMETVDIDIAIADWPAIEGQLVAFDIILNYDPAVVEVTAVNYGSPGQALLSADPQSIGVATLGDAIPDSDGAFKLPVIDLGPFDADEDIDGEETSGGYLARITLQGLAPGQSDLTLSTPGAFILTEEALGSVVPVSQSNQGFVYVGEPCPPPPFPQPGPTPPPLPPSYCSGGPDSDGDGFSDCIETFVGTDPAKNCAATGTSNDEDPDPWPVDADDNQVVDTIDVITLMVPHLSVYDARADLNTDSAGNMLDLLPGKPYFSESCTPSASASIVVDSTGDTNSRDGVITLREAILLATGVLAVGTLDGGEADNVTGTPGAASPDTITFDAAVFPPGTPSTITLTGALPALSTDIDTIDGSEAGVIVDGVTESFICFNVTSNANTIKGIKLITNCTHGVRVTGHSNTIGGDTAGERNVISGNGDYGVYVTGSGATWNQVQGNYIGTDVNGTVDLGNWVGVHISGGASGNTIGGTADEERNLISGNTYGVYMGSGATGNHVQGNYIGTEVTGTAGLGDAQYGVQIDGTSGNTIGGTAAGAGNVISGHILYGVAILGSGSTGNQVQGNYIGTDVTGTADVGNASAGVHITGDASDNTVGGTAAGAGNVISGNDSNGVWIMAGGATGNHVQGNYIGTDVTGTADLGNTLTGVYISAGASGNTVGGTTAAERNVISGNDSYGVTVAGSGSTGNEVKGNYIGTDVTGAAELGNIHGVWIVSGAVSNTVGGTAAGAGNVISGNVGNGVHIRSSGTTGNQVQGNYIGTNAAGTDGLGNSTGVLVDISASGNTIGGTTTPGSCDAACNVISGNTLVGVHITDGGTTLNEVKGNYIGTNADGDADIPNFNGVAISASAAGNIIGGTTTPGSCDTDCNVISGNTASGVDIGGPATNGNVVRGNYIGTNPAGTDVLGSQQIGVNVISGAQENHIGGPDAGEGNVISGNWDIGVVFYQADTDGNVVVGNLIGTDALGMAQVPNGTGVSIEDGAENNVVGGSTEGERNVISGNSEVGVAIDGWGTITSGNIVKGNYVGTDLNGTAALGNGDSGVQITGSAQGSTIGGIAAGEGNTIAFNVGDGVEVTGVTSTGNTIRGNSIHSNGDLGIDLGGDGVNFPQDPGDGDSGPNNLQNFPVIDSVTFDGVSTTISGSINTQAGTVSIDVYASPAADASGYGEGQVYLGSTTATVTVPPEPWTLVTGGFPPNAIFTATATAANPSTSEFSQALDQGPGPGLSLTNIVRQGETTPLGGTYATFGQARVPNTEGDLVFWASTSLASEGIFKYSEGGGITPLVALNDPSPIGGSFTALGQVPVMNEGGDVVFWAQVDLVTEGIFLWSDSAQDVFKVKSFGDSTPTGGVTFTGFSHLGKAAVPVINNEGDIVFWGKTTAGEGVFLVSDPDFTEVAVTGGDAPGTGGGTFSSFVWMGSWPTVPIVTNNGQVSFWGAVTGGTASEGIFLFTLGVVSDVVVAGEAAPPEIGGDYAFFGHIPSPSNSGEVAFWAAINGIAAPSCPGYGAPCGVFKFSEGTVSKVIASGDTGPPGVGGTIVRPSTVALMSDSGQVTFWADISNGMSNQALVRATNGVQENVAAVGNDAPMTPTSGTFSDFVDAYVVPTVPVPNNLGQVAFWGEVSGGSGTEGIYVTGGTASIETKVAALAGKPAPGCGPDCKFGTNFDLDIDSDGQAVFANALTDGTGDSGIFLFFAGDPEQAVAVHGNDTPEGMTGTYSEFGPPVSNDSGKIVSRAMIADGSASEGIFLFFAGEAVETAQKLAAENDPAPDTSLFFAGFADPAINSAGHVVARVTLKTGGEAPAGEALYLFFAGEPGVPSASGPELVCLAGDASCPAGSLFFAGFAEHPAINEDDQVVAKVTLEDGGGTPAGEALYLFFAGSPTPPMLVAGEGDPAPTLTPDLFFAGFGELPDINLDVSLNGNVAFQADLKTAGEADAGEGLFLFFAGSAETKLLAEEGLGVPTAVGGNYGPFGDPAINKHNQVVARADVTAGGAGEALFLFFAGSPLDPVDPVAVTEIALDADPLPADAPAGSCASGAGTFGGGPPVFPYIAFNDAIQVVYVANIDCPAADPDSQGVFIASLDWDGDLTPDFLDNCPLIRNDDQNNTDKALAQTNPEVVGDDLGNSCDDDLDGDGLDNVLEGPFCGAIPDCDGDRFIDGREVYMGTEPTDACAETVGENDEGPPDMWPVDFNDDQRAAMQDVIFAFVTTLAPEGLNQDAVGPLVRVDMNGNGFINMQDVILGYVTKLVPDGLNTMCTP